MNNIEEESSIVHRKTVDQEQLYENLSVQLGHHTDDFNERVEAYEKSIETEQKQDEDTAN